MGRAIVALKIAKPSIALDPGGVIAPPGGIAEEILDHGRGIITAIHAELGDPDGIPRATGDIVCLRDVVLEVLDVVGGGVPVEVEEVDGEAEGGGVAEECSQVREAVLPGVRDGDAADLEWREPVGCPAARERLHVRRVALQRPAQRHARRHAREARVWLVEPEQRVRAVVRDREVHIHGPDRRQCRVVVEEERDEVEL